MQILLPAKDDAQLAIVFPGGEAADRLRAIDGGIEGPVGLAGDGVERHHLAVGGDDIDVAPHLNGLGLQAAGFHREAPDFAQACDVGGGDFVQRRISVGRAGAMKVPIHIGVGVGLALCRQRKG